MKGGLMHGKENLGETFVKDWDTNEPLTVYHATDEEFRQFDNSHLGKNAEPEDYNVAKLGHWFAEARGSLNKRKKIIEAYLNIRNPRRGLPGQRQTRTAVCHLQHQGQTAVF